MLKTLIGLTKIGKRHAWRERKMIRTDANSCSDNAKHCLPHFIQMDICCDEFEAHIEYN